MVQFGDDTYGKERAIEKLFRCIPKKYKQIARSIESLLDLYTMSIEEAIGHLKVVDGDEPQPLSRPITVGGKLHLTREQWEACQGDGKKGSPLPRRVTASAASGTRRAEAPKPEREDVPRVAPAEGQGVSTATTRLGPCRTGGGASSALGTRKHRVISSDIGRNGSRPF
jgi:hypothetical protein